MGCIATDVIVITEPPLLNIAVTASTDPSCFGVCDGDATTSTSGGTTLYTYNWDTSPVQTNANDTGMCDGTWNVTVEDANGCLSNTSVVLTEPAVLALSATQVNVTCNGGTDGSIDLIVTGGTTAYTYAWSNSASTEDLTNLAQGGYTVTVTDANGCADILLIPLTETPARVITPTTTAAHWPQSVA